ncbi:Cerato-platanin [Gymnopus androsaceus JB14]|uniref:Cerato-platanin n=1 Tax=Gymnopus androsaceus JB14 TaxID=1447944 RepID=A0A6A4I1H7_9AGAR|nr:Cerato-platanin [Gymnopus androsaceus JB14]
MKLLSLFVSAAVAASAFADTLKYDTIYDIGSESLDVVACSDGVNGLLTKGFTTFNSLPSFPNIGAFAAVTEWDSPNCGTCWEIVWGDSAPLYALAIDVAGTGLINLSEEAMNTVTGGLAVELGSVAVTSTQVDASKCGL